MLYIEITVYLLDFVLIFPATNTDLLQLAMSMPQEASVHTVFVSCVEYKKRYKIFQENLGKAKKIQEKEQGSAKYGVTQFSDLSGNQSRLGDVQCLPKIIQYML